MSRSTNVPDSLKLARLLGPSLVVMTAAEMVNAHIWASSNAPTMFMNGTMLFVGGLAILQNHNVWCVRWPVTITLIGCGAATLGFVRMMWPERMVEMARKGSPKDARISTLPVMFAGLYLCLVSMWKGKIGLVNNKIA